MKNEIIERFSSEVDKQINQFGIDLINAISNEIDEELDKKQRVLGLNSEQVDSFRVVLQTARQKVLASYELETKDSRTDSPYMGESVKPVEPIKHEKVA